MESNTQGGGCIPLSGSFPRLSWQALAASKGKSKLPISAAGEPARQSSAPQLPKSFMSTSVNYDHDKISQLPDDILISIISRLTVTEAVSTSILSKRWRHLHNYTTRLDFSLTSETYCHVVSKRKFLKKYATVISRTLGSHNGGEFLQEFRLSLPFYGLFLTTVEDTWPVERWLMRSWIDFALARQAPIIHMHVICIDAWIRFPYIIPRRNEFLKDLSLKAVDLDKRVFMLILENYVALERFSVENSSALGSLRIIGVDLAPKLKQLAIRRCSRIKFIKIIDMPNIESFECYEMLSEFKLVLRNVPSLCELGICKKIGFRILSRGIISDQLIKLKLSLVGIYTYGRDYMDGMLRFPKLVKLQHMECEYKLNMYSFYGLHKLIHFIEACPCLQKLEIKFIWSTGFLCQRSDEKYIENPIKRRWSRDLKRVKLSGLIGCKGEMEFVSYIVGNGKDTTALEELVMETSPDQNARSRRRARARLRHWFRPKLRDSVHFVVV
ncbi:PREDICTED: FBD-associated F-box protein At4g10400-like [Erythranthe guttata]|uniref:FBD-associated F-box protein At4g10400-like n=1 Tax=Erythranthe guttata TaxID=4155 RepID=UPI00064DC225|nr:PREDICTED: FBD-associated F-box protein At4g10400-like [Erythranthe guttata]|eukprot:XP_012836239.1 PREDICTED: FBD-associated F-box protein At4g10400-like [Erythranthe guttata]